MNKAEFIKVCGLRGICTQQIAAMYAARFADDKEYADSDFEDAFRYADKLSYYQSSRGMRQYDGTLSTKYFVNISDGRRQ